MSSVRKLEREANPSAIRQSWARSPRRGSASSCSRSSCGSYQTRAASISAGQPAAPVRSSAKSAANAGQSPAARLGIGRGGRRAAGCEAAQDVLRGRRPDAGQELQHPKARQPVAGILGEAQDGEQVLDVRGFQELQAAELHERDVAAGELDLERPAVMRGAEEHRLRLQRGARLPRRQHLGADVVGLRGLVGDGDEQRPRVRPPFGPELLGEALARLADHRVGGRQDGLGRAVVARERDDARPGLEPGGEVEDVAHLRRPEAVDRLRVVADDGDAPAVGLQRPQDLRLQPVGVLVLVDQHVVEIRPERGRRGRVGEHLRPVEQEVVVIEHLCCLLRLDVGREERLQLGRPAEAPGEIRLEQRLERPAGIDRPGVDREAGALGREPALRCARGRAGAGRGSSGPRSRFGRAG